MPKPCVQGTAKCLSEGMAGGDDIEDDSDSCWHHQYYQWVALVLVMQAGCFYAPKYLWQVWEEGRLEMFFSWGGIFFMWLKTIFAS